MTKVFELLLSTLTLDIPIRKYMVETREMDKRIYLIYSISHCIRHIRESNVRFSKYEFSLTTKTSHCCVLFRHQCEMSCEFIAAIMGVEW